MRKSFLKILPLALFVVVFSSCSKLEDFGDTNNNPAVTSTPITAALLTQTLSGMGAYSAVNAQALYCQYYSETQYTDVSLYSLVNTSSASQYSSRLMDLQNIIKINSDPATAATAAKNGSNKNQIAIARILKAYIYWYATDTWGDVPYADALTGSPAVTYSTQEFIYKDLIKELTEAVAQFEVSSAAIKGDIVYAGDLAKWKKLANSMRALMALQLTKKYPAAGGYAAIEFAAAIADGAGVIESNADNFTLVYVGGNFKNPFYNMYDGRKDYGESNTMVSILTGLSDSRQTVFGTSVVGMPYGWTRTKSEAFTSANPTWSRVLADAQRTDVSPVVMLSAANVFLARAEAAHRLWTTEVAQTMYTNGINASFAQWGQTTPGAYNVTLPGGAANIQAIATQQYIAFYPAGWHGWALWRRTNFPTLTPAVDATNGTAGIPRRYAYGTVELNLTKAEVQKAIDRLPGGANTQSAKIWWDQD